MSNYDRPNGAGSFEFETIAVGDAFQEVMKLRILDGRWFSADDDGANYRPVVVNQRLARELFGASSPVGKPLAIPGEGRPEERIVGVIADFRKSGEFSAPGNFAIFRADPQSPSAHASENLILRLRPGSPKSTEARIAAALQAVGRGWSFEIRPLSEMRTLANKVRLAPLLAGIVVAVFLILMVALGLTGVLWQNVTQRIKEIGLRRAKGATARDIQKQILGELVVLASAGIVLGARDRHPVPLLLSLIGSVSGGLIAGKSHHLRRASLRPDAPVRRVPQPHGVQDHARGGASLRIGPHRENRGHDPHRRRRPRRRRLALPRPQAGPLPPRRGSIPRARPCAAIEADDIGLVLQDMNFSRNTTARKGSTFCREIRARRPALPVVLMTAWGSITLAVKGMRSGASDFITKPWTNQQILQTVRTGLELAAAAPGAAGESPRTREELDALYDLRGIERRHPRFLQVLDLAGRVAATDASVLITGESGTGKELIAEAIHKNSPRRRRASSRSTSRHPAHPLRERDVRPRARRLHGRARGPQGPIRAGRGGTIFLDEIGDVDPSAQVKLLRVPPGPDLRGPRLVH